MDQLPKLYQYIISGKSDSTFKATAVALIILALCIIVFRKTFSFSDRSYLAICGIMFLQDQIELRRYFARILSCRFDGIRLAFLIHIGLYFGGARITDFNGISHDVRILLVMDSL